MPKLKAEHFFNGHLRNGLKPGEPMAALGEQWRAQRLCTNLTLEEGAKNAGLSISVGRRLSSREGATLSSFVAGLKALRRGDGLSTLQPP